MSETSDRIRKLETELEACRQEARERNREMDAFLYAVSHDLKSPLVSIEGFASQLLRQGEAMEPGPRFRLERICYNANYMQQQLSALLELSRIGRLDGAREAVDLGRVAAEVVQSLDPEFRSRGIDVTVDPSLPTIQGEPRRILQLFEALLGNAVFYMGPNEPRRITVRCDDGGGHWLMSVEDTGLGVPDSQKARIFGMFQRHYVKEREGIGTGLAYARRIVETHGGKIWVESEGEGRGSAFRFTLPKA